MRRVPPITSAIAASALAAVVVLLAARPLPGYDTWWHLASGREMARTGRLLETDPFSFMTSARHWMNHEWLWQAAAWGFWRATGGPDPTVAGADTAPSTPEREAAVRAYEAAEAAASSKLTLVNGLLLAAAFLMGFAACIRSGTGPALAAAVVLGCAWGARVRFLVRPEGATLLLLAGVLLCVHVATRASMGRRLAMTLIPLLIALGANLHPGALLLPPVVALYLLGERARPRANREAPPPELWLAAALVAASFLATLANPHGWRLWKAPMNLGDILQARYSSVPEWLPPTLGSAPLLFGALPLLALLVILGWRRGRVDPASLLPQAALGLLAATGIRHVGMFFVALPFALAVPVASLRRWRPDDPTGEVPVQPVGLGRRPAAVEFAAALLCAAVAGLAGWSGAGLGVDRSRTPVDACRFIALHEPQGRLYNDLRFGGYLIWRFAPRRPVFVDGRMELYAPLLGKLERIHSGEAGYEVWQRLIERNRIQGALVRYAEGLKGVVYPAAGGSPPRRDFRAYSAYLFPPPAWALVYWDDAAMLFLRTGEANAALIRRFSYEAINPEDNDYLVARTSQDPAYRVSILRDLDRRLAEAPDSARAEDIAARIRAAGE